MKNLNNYIFIFLVVGLCYSTNTNAQERESLGFYYQQYNRIIDNQSYTSWNMANNQHIYGYPEYHGGDNQQWIIMPTYPGSNKFYIVNKASGGVVDISYNNHNRLYINNDIHSGDNQIFTLDEFETNKYHISSPHNNYQMFADFTPQPALGIHFYPKHGRSNQVFSFIDVGKIPNAFKDYQVYNNRHLAQPPILTEDGGGFSENGIYNEIIVGETIIPFAMVKDETMSRKDQVKESPYYKLVRKKYWKRLGSPITIPKGGISGFTEEYQKGIERSSTRKLEKMLEITHTIDGKIGYKRGGLSGEVAYSLERKLRVTTTQIDAFIENTSEKRIIEYKSDPNYEVVQTIYVEAQKFELYRMDGTRVLEWEVLSDNINRKNYFPAIDPPKIHFEAEDAQHNAVVDKFNGRKYVEWLTEVGKYVSFDVYVRTAGTYELQLQYSADSNTHRTMSLYRNDTDIQQVRFPKTGDWHSYHAKYIQVTLPAGNNTLKFQYNRDDNGWINIDYLKIKLLNISRLTNKSKNKKLQNTKKTFNIETIQPNPFINTLSINYTSTMKGQTKVTLYNVVGKLVKRNNTSYINKGKSTVTIDGSDLKPGLYILKAEILTEDGQIFYHQEKVIKK